MIFSVIIVNYKVPEYVHQCLLSLKKAELEGQTEYFVVDNASNDHSVSFLKGLHPDVHFIENQDNVGFSKANNMAIKRAKGKYLLVINPDTFVNESLMKDSAAFMDEHPEVGSVGVKMLASNGRFAPESRRGVPKPMVAFAKFVGLCKLFPKHKLLGKYYMCDPDKNKQVEIEILSGACMVLRNETIQKTGGFDEDFFMYGEDIDLSYRILKQGYKNYYIPSPIVHYKGESTQKLTFRYVNNFHKSMILFFRKHFKAYAWLFEWPILLAVGCKAVFNYVKVVVKRLFKTKSFEQAVKDIKYLVLTNKNSQDEPAVKVLNRYGYHADVVQIDENVKLLGHQAVENAANKYDFVVYNTDDFTFGEIMSFFEINDYKPGNLELAIYHPDIDRIITSIQVL